MGFSFNIWWKTGWRWNAAFIHSYGNIYDFFRFLNFYLCGRLENMVQHTGPSHSKDTNMMTLFSFHWPSTLHISW